ncbi:MAG: peptidase C15 [Symploca sp. SIO3C6]|uniref:Peptidase C15 n=1 Tax=Symploca sp. SIO1C4 TaxID=2607765 RepID=A0A6B3N845_9CYAN|nr:peptidase C15 [Symploca sp. SIO3C6]NER27770.1 peptidase C15 [Symploca sp. SIO1C4]NET07246.1 peptidase C15 [Symploca sp. SIO2B6]NET50770.1 peptidase C15 [Merismopedia sp. SIO2A8]
MHSQILLTSFDTWLPDQVSNSSDDLLERISQLEDFPVSLSFLRKLPVDIAQASSRVIIKIEEMQPAAIICCGLARKRLKLTVESGASCGDALIKTALDLEKLVAGSVGTEISHDAGKFVCEGLYYQVLKYLREHKFNSYCIFVHVPPLSAANLPGIVADFSLIIQRVASFAKIQQTF